jgi:GntR family transcriptional regulator
MHSGLIISQADPRPMYLQIKEQIRHRVAVGDWPPGREIPSIRQLAAEIRVSVITVKRAYLELEQEGVIVTHHGKGSFVADSPELATTLHEHEIDEHLSAAVRLARQLGVSEADLAARLHEIARDPMKTDTVKRDTVKRKA